MRPTWLLGRTCQTPPWASTVPRLSVPATALQCCQARLPFPSRLLQAAITGRMCVPSVLHVPAMLWAHGHGSCASQPGKLSARMPCVPLPPGSHVPQCHVEVSWCSCVCGLLHLCALAVQCCVCLGEIACCACPLCALLHTQTGCSSWPAGVASKCVLPRRAAGAQLG